MRDVAVVEEHVFRTGYAIRGKTNAPTFDDVSAKDSVPRLPANRAESERTREKSVPFFVRIQNELAFLSGRLSVLKIEKFLVRNRFKPERYQLVSLVKPWDDRLKERRGKNIVAIGDIRELAGRDVESRVSRRGLSAVLLMDRDDSSVPRRVFVDRLPAAVRAAVVDED